MFVGIKNMDTTLSVENITNEELRRRLINDFNIDCGPVTPQTKRILLKKLIKLEQERQINGSNATNGSWTEADQNSPITNGNDVNGGDISIIQTPEMTNFQQTPTRQPVRKHTSKQKINSEEEDAIETFKVCLFQFLIGIILIIIFFSILGCR